jgi:hypothetical protein
MALSKEEQEILLEATRLIGEPGRWIQGKLFKTQGDDTSHSYCAIGAVCKASGVTQEALMGGAGKLPMPEHLTIDELHRRLERVARVREALLQTLNRFQGSGNTIESFNDAWGRTQEQVKEIFCATVKREVEEANGAE